MVAAAAAAAVASAAAEAAAAAAASASASAALDDDLINSSVKVVGSDGIGIPRAFAAVVAETKFLTSRRIKFRIIVLLVLSEQFFFQYYLMFLG